MLVWSSVLIVLLRSVDSLVMIKWTIEKMCDSFWRGRCKPIAGRREPWATAESVVTGTCFFAVHYFWHCIAAINVNCWTQWFVHCLLSVLCFWFEYGCCFQFTFEYFIPRINVHSVRGGDHWDVILYSGWKLFSRTWNPITFPWMKQLMCLRIVHSGDWCRRLVLRTFRGTCQKWWWWWWW